MFLLRITEAFTDTSAFKGLEHQLVTRRKCTVPGLSFRPRVTLSVL